MTAPSPAGARAARPKTVAGFLLLVLLLFVAIDPTLPSALSTLEEVHQRSGLAKTVVYIGAYLAAAFAVGLMLLSPRRIVRWIAAGLTVVGVCTQLAARSVNGHGFGLWEARLFFNEVAHAEDVARTFGTELVFAIGIGAVCVGLVVFLRHRLRLIVRFPLILLLVVGLGPMTYVIVKTDGGVAAFPSALKVPVVTLIANLPGDVVSEREDPVIGPGIAPLAPNVILIVDESVRGDVLGINGGPVKTPFLESLGDDLLNFGVACAATNSSAPSNMVIQSGIQPDALLANAQRAMTMATVFQYARAAGFTTSLLAGQELRRWYYASPYDLDHIDRLVEPQSLGGGFARHEIDGRIAELVETDLPRRMYSFTYVLKLGVHFPYEDKRPEGYWPIESTLYPDETDEERRAVLDNYGRSVRWAVDVYCERLFKRLEGHDFVVVYTSDHGQSLREGGMTATHGVWKDPPRSQANVPLFIYGTSEAMRRLVATRVGAGGRALAGRATHYEIFPTVLYLMGYGLSEVEKAFGPTLFTSDGRRPRRFLSGDPFKPGVRQLNAFDN